MLAQAVYYDNILNESIRDLAGATADQLISVRLVLRQIAQAVIETLPSSDGVSVAETLLEFAPVLSRSSLRDLLKELTPNLTREQANQILEFFTFGSDSKTSGDLWFRPFVRLGQDRVLAVLAPLASGNLEREIETWFSRLHLVKEEKGNAFEVRVRTGVERVAYDSELKSMSEIYQSHFSVEIDHQCEEIDFIARLGNKLIIGEIKCLAYPVGCIELHNHMEKLHQGCEQAARKAKFVVINMDAVIRSATLHFIVPVEDIEVIPLVISNYPFGIGTSHEDVPIVDLIALEAFFIGTYEHGVHTRGVQVLDAGRKVGFWDVPENASDALKRYLACPPQVEMFHDCEEEHSQFVPLASRPGSCYWIQETRLNPNKVSLVLRRQTQGTARRPRDNETL